MLSHADECFTFEAQETVNEIVETSGSNLDVKFGVALNELLEDSIIVSVIASDFEEQYDFTSTHTSIIKPVTPESRTYHAEDDEDDDSFLPNILKELEAEEN